MDLTLLSLSIKVFEFEFYLSPSLLRRSGKLILPDKNLTTIFTHTISRSDYHSNQDAGGM